MFYESHSYTRLLKQTKNKTFHHNQEQNQSLKIHKYIYDIAFTVTIIIHFGQVWNLSGWSHYNTQIQQTSCY